MAVSAQSGEKRNLNGIATYTQHWQKNAADDDDTHKESRLNKYTEVVNSYYDGATQLYEFGWGSSFHFARYYKGEPFFQAIARHEHYLSAQIGLKPGMKVLDVGCGVGGPAREIARFSGASIVGVNNNDFQVDRANKYTAKTELKDQVSFVKGDFMHLSELFEPNTFDAVYAIEATVHAPSFEGVYGEIKKVLKPGGIVGIYEWCMTDDWDPSIPEHKKIAHGIEIGDGIAEMRKIDQARQALKTVGFEILHEEDLADRNDFVPWYYALEGDIWKVQSFWDAIMVFRMTTVGKFCTQTTLKMLERLHLAPQGMHSVGEALKTAADALVAGGQKKLFTPMMLFVAKKPLE